MRPATVTLALLALGGCRRTTQQIGEYTLQWDEDAASLAVDWRGRRLVDLQELAVGTGDATIEFQTGSYRFSDVTTDLTAAASLSVESSKRAPLWSATLQGPGGASVGLLTVSSAPAGLLRMDLAALDGTADRARVSFACAGDPTFLGGGAYALDVDHAGEAFDLWVSEPGIGRVEDDEPPDLWFLTGTRHSTSYPSPFLLLPEERVGVVMDTNARVDLDLCATRSDRWSMTGWDGQVGVLLVPGATALEVTERYARASGPPLVPPDWAFGVWGDAVRGEAAVRSVQETLREAGVPATVIWTEDWKGEDEGPFGYKIGDEWFVDRTLYPDVEQLAADLEDDGFKWFGYFKPFLAEDTETWAEASDLTIRTDEGDVYWMRGADLNETTVLDPTDPDAVAWAQARMVDALDLGFDGWMQDFGEWIPPDARFAGMDPVRHHNAHPSAWHSVAAEVVQGEDALIFTRSGWVGSGALAAVAWGGDQRTSFDPDDGYPTVIAMGLGTSLAGSPFFGHDIGGYSGEGNGPSTKELWFRWCSLGAFSPIMRTHHGRKTEENWAFDRDAETLAHFARYGREHVRLFPYLSGLAARAGEQGTPLLLPPAMLYGGDWGRTDAWLLGEALLVAPVLEEGATSRDVDLPPGTDWTDWWTLAPATSGTVSAAMDEIPVFAAAGTVVPTLTEVPDTLVPGVDGPTTLADVDGARTVYVFGAGGRFEEGDGTTYVVKGRPGDAGEVTRTLSSGAIALDGATLQVSGGPRREYRVIYVP